MRFSKEVKEVEDYEGGFSYWPIIVLDGEVTYFKEQGNIVFYDNKEDAEEYIKDQMLVNELYKTLVAFN